MNRTLIHIGRCSQTAIFAAEKLYSGRPLTGATRVMSGDNVELHPPL